MLFPERRDRESRDSGARGESWTAGGNYPSFTADRTAWAGYHSIEQQHNASPFRPARAGLLEGEATGGAAVAIGERETARAGGRDRSRWWDWRAREQRERRRRARDTEMVAADCYGGEANGGDGEMEQMENGEKERYEGDSDDENEEECQIGDKYGEGSEIEDDEESGEEEDEEKEDEDEDVEEEIVEERVRAKGRD
ncbi:hypothetical protein Syun_012488 [Stephania yunnanensis]|uniref:Uncharacterized protein n=1 Tax=Stephania yunnanensis TaxID=152371 RepID=A0AAP0K0W8_9MAGN